MRKFATLPVLFLSGCTTRVGSPVAYWQEGLWPFVGFLLVCLLLLIAVLQMKTTANRPNGGPIAGIAGFLVVALALLQFLPPTDEGLRLFPLAPWEYAGWLSIPLSVGAWVCLGVALLAALLGDEKEGGTFSVCVLITFVLSGVLTLWEVPDETMLAEAESSYEQEIEEWRDRASQKRSALDRLTEDRKRVATLLERLDGTETGARDELLTEKAELDRQIEAVRRELSVLEAAIVRAESRLRRLSRHEVLADSTQLSEAEFESMSRIQRELEEEVRSVRSRPPIVLPENEGTGTAAFPSRLRAINR